MSLWGNHFLIITLFGLFSITSPSYFHNIRCGSSANASCNEICIFAGSESIFTVEPNEK